MHLLRSLARGGVAPVVRRTFSIAQPAVTAGFTIAPDNGRAWSVESVQCVLVSDSNAGNRFPALSLTEGSRLLWGIPPLAVQIASTTVGYTWIRDYFPTQVAAVGAIQAMSLPPAILLPGWTLTLTVGAVQAGDQVSQITYSVLESFVGDTEAEYDTARAVARHAHAISELLEGEVPGL